MFKVGKTGPNFELRARSDLLKMHYDGDFLIRCVILSPPKRASPLRFTRLVWTGLKICVTKTFVGTNLEMSPKRGNFSQNLFAASKLYVYFDLVADKINSVHRKGGKMIVYCRAGMSRSAALCIAYFMKYHGMTVDDAFQNVRERRPIIHPNSG